MRIIFVYAGSPHEASQQSPYTITKNVYKYLISKGLEVQYYNWTDTDDVDIQPDDIVLGHPCSDPNTVIQKIFRSNKPCRAKCLIHPLHYNKPEDNRPFHELARQADVIFSICGPYWYDTLENSEFAFWKPKIIRLDMCVDSEIYQYKKTSFNEPKNRQLVYIGSAIPNKNLAQLTQMMQLMPDVRLHWYGGYKEHPLGQLPNVDVTGWVNILDYADEICYNGDIVVSVSYSDANPTTIVESMAFGLIPACTPQSGYYNNDLFTELYLYDPQRSVAQLRKLLNTPSEVLQERSLRGRSEICSKYDWGTFCNTIWSNISKYVN